MITSCELFDEFKKKKRSPAMNVLQPVSRWFETDKQTN